MPEFSLKIGGPKDYRRFSKLPAFTRGCIEAAFFCGVNVDDERNGYRFGFCDLHPCALDTFVDDCAVWESLNDADLRILEAARSSYDREAAGHDYWFTRNGHGTGFWDRGFTGPAGEAAKRLTDSAKAAGTLDLYYNEEDEKVYLT